MGREEENPLTPASTDAAQEGKGIQVTRTKSSLSSPTIFHSHSDPVGPLGPGPRSLDRDSEPTHPVTVYHSTYPSTGKVKGWKVRRGREGSKKLRLKERREERREGMEEGMQLLKQKTLFHVHKTAPGVLWSWTQEVVWFNRWRELKLKLKKNTAADVFLTSQTITHQPCTGMLARTAGASKES